MYQALVRLPQSENDPAPPRAPFDWAALTRLLVRLFRARR